MRRYRLYLLASTLFVVGGLVGYVAVTTGERTPPAQNDGSAVFEPATLSEAAQYAGFTPVALANVPEGMEITRIHVHRMNLNGPFVSVHTFYNYPDATTMGLMLIQDDRQRRTQPGTLSHIDGVDYYQALSRDGTYTTLTWLDDRYQYELTGYHSDNITAETLQGMATAMR